VTRELLRYRRKLVDSQIAERNRLLRLLETANIKLASPASDVFGVSGMSMLKPLIEGTAGRCVRFYPLLHRHAHIHHV
jgi:hypothetical protein